MPPPPAPRPPLVCLAAARSVRCSKSEPVESAECPKARYTPPAPGDGDALGTLIHS
jgi:hypothetical protein